ncbi:uncharacterized protein [Watersipora subatra]|uniref:uncharacterized protein n=1 Tax=Watersipora subatra TaxID=2589382 RepID=UPI00355B70E6
MLMLGRELRLPDQLESHPPPTEFFPTHEHALKVQRRLQTVQKALRQRQMKVRQEDREEPPLYASGDKVWLMNKRQRRRENPKLQAKFVAPYQVLKALGNHTYLVERQGQSSIQSEGKLKPYHACQERLGQAPATLEPRRGPNIKGAQPSRPKKRQEEEKLLLEAAENRGQAITPGENPAGPEEGESQRRPPCSERINPATREKVSGELEANPVETEETTTPDSINPATQSTPVRHNPRPARTTRKPEWYGDGVCYSMELSENGSEVKQEGSKTVLTDRTKAFPLKHWFSLDDVKALEKMDCKGNTSLQDLLTLVTTSLKETEEALGAPEPVGVAAPKGDQEWEAAIAKASPSCHGEAVSEADDEDLDRTLTRELETVVTNGGESVVECDSLRAEPKAELNRARLCSVRQNNEGDRDGGRERNRQREGKKKRKIDNRKGESKRWRGKKETERGRVGEKKGRKEGEREEEKETRREFAYSSSPKLFLARKREICILRLRQEKRNNIMIEDDFLESSKQGMSNGKETSTTAVMPTCNEPFMIPVKTLRCSQDVYRPIVFVIGSHLDGRQAFHNQGPALGT